MLSTTLILVSLFSLSFHGASATFSFGNCLNDESARQVAQGFANIFTSSPQSADQVFTLDATGQSDSINWLMSNGTNCMRPLGTLTFASRDEFEAEQASQPPIPFILENVYHNCDTVFIRWYFDQQPQKVQGLTFLHTQCQNSWPFGQSTYLIDHLFTELNSGAFLYDRGDFRGTPPASCVNQKRDVSGLEWAA